MHGAGDGRPYPGSRSRTLFYGNGSGADFKRTPGGSDEVVYADIAGWGNHGRWDLCDDAYGAPEGAGRVIVNLIIEYEKIKRSKINYKFTYKNSWPFYFFREVLLRR